jgi:hypothetical protein
MPIRRSCQSPSYTLRTPCARHLAGGRRRSETLVAKAESLRQTADGNYFYTLDLADGSRRRGPGSIDEKPLVGVAADYLR